MNEVKRPTNHLDKNEELGDFLHGLESLFRSKFPVYVFTTTSYGDEFVREYTVNNCMFRDFRKWICQADYVGQFKQSKCPDRMLPNLKTMTNQFSQNPDQVFAGRFCRSNGVEMVEHWVVAPKAYRANRYVWVPITLTILITVGIFVAFFVFV